MEMKTTGRGDKLVQGAQVNAFTTPTPYLTML